MDEVRKLASRIGALSFQAPSPASAVSAVSPSPSEAYECELCTDTSSDSILFPPVTRTCNHKPAVCQTCIQAWAKTVVENRQCLTATCPICPEAMKDTDFQKHCEPDVFERYSDRALLEHLAQDPDFVHCPLPDCPSGQIHDNTGMVEPSRFFCVGCSGESCLHHQVPWHHGKTCAQYDEDREDGEGQSSENRRSERFLRQSDRHRQCPGCRAWIQRSGGCDHITCKNGACRTEFCWACGGEWLFGHTEDCRYRNAFNRLPRLPRLNHDPEQNADARRGFPEEVQAPPNAIRNPELDSILGDILVYRRRAARRRAREGQAAANDQQLGPIAGEGAQWRASLETEIYGVALDPVRQRRQEARDRTQFNDLLNVPAPLTPHTPRVHLGLPGLVDRQRRTPYAQGLSPLLDGPLQRPDEGRAATGFPPDALPIRSRPLQELNQTPRRPAMFPRSRERPVNGEEAILLDGQRRRLPPDYLGRPVPEILVAPLTSETPYGRERLEGRLSADIFADQRRERREGRLAADRVADERRERRERSLRPPYDTARPYDATRLRAGVISREQVGTRRDTHYVPPVTPVERALREMYNWMHPVRRASHAER
ncbi:hypothetical protein HYFRA_00013052 [Hymenoscyphus fraxineus]|uniref:RBR-type E3 ubiquitin transferase n=1 Tax=Hymenoscyphus fraxineus TaxID=746836 RepID=A0A9N9L858_9HELO|nr:hypothetical protein HYFRA_00013052 [Hymenoscyphus fraxineus]